MRKAKINVCTPKWFPPGKRSQKRINNEINNPNNFNVLRSEIDKESLMLKQKKNVEHLNKQKKLKSTIVTIDSRNRNKLPKIITENSRKLSNNTIYCKNNSNLLLIHCPKHSFNINKGPVQIIIKGVIGDKITQDGETVYDLVLYYDDRSIEGPDEYLDFITPGMDKEISNEFKKILIKQGIKFKMGSKVNSVKNEANLMHKKNMFLIQ